MYAELHAHSNFTFLEGGSHPEELVERAVELELQALALTDCDGLYGCVRFAKAAAERKLPAIIGSTLRLESGDRLVLLVENERGYANLCEIISRGQLNGTKGGPRLEYGDFDGRTDGLIALCGVPDAAAVARARERFEGRLFLELQHHLHAEDARRCRQLLELAADFELPYVATNGVMYARREDARLADVLFCVKEKTTLADARERALLRPNAEYHLKSPRMMAQIFCGYPEKICAIMRGDLRWYSALGRSSARSRASASVVFSLTQNSTSARRASSRRAYMTPLVATYGNSKSAASSSSCRQRRASSACK